MKKRRFSTTLRLSFVLILLSLLMLPTHAEAASESDLTFKLNSDGTSYSVTDCVSSASDELTIPATYNGKPVARISAYAFEGCTGLTSITIPNSVTGISEGAFYSCTGLTSITIPNSVTSIGSYAFDGCSSLTTITIPDSVTSIGEFAFTGCAGLTSITIPDSVTSIGASAFSGCSGLKEMTIPFVGGSYKTANDYYQYPFGYIFGESSYAGSTATGQSYHAAWMSSTTVTTYYIPNSLTTVAVTGGNILYGAFNNCASLTSITISDGVTSIDDYAFDGCNSLTTITIPDSITSIGDSAFEDCKINKLIIAEGSKTITSSMVICEDTLREVVIPDSVTSIGDHAFYYCTNLTSITIPNSVTSIGASTFYSCTGLTSITIPNSVTSIGDRAFSYCNRLTSITIPDSVTSIGENAFYSSTIRKLIIAEGSNEITSTMVISKHTLQEVVIPDSVTTIGDYAFSQCKLTNITIPNSVTSIGTRTFFNCTGLTSITIPNSVTSIGNDAFRNCTRLISITIGDSVTDIGRGAFSECTGLTDVYITDPNMWCKIRFLDDYANPMYYAGFLHVLDAEGNEVTDITLDNTVTTIPEYRFKNCKYLTSITIPDSVTSVGSYAFDGCTIQKLMIAEGSKRITWSMVISKQTLQEVVIPESVTSISNDAFYGCTKLTSITMPNSVTTIGNQAFYNCSRLTSIKIPNSVTDIGSDAFYNCTGLTGVYITDPSAWCKISFSNDYANPMSYAGCLHILDANGMEVTGIIFDDTVTTIPADRFKNCKYVTTLTVSNKLTSIDESAFFGSAIRKLIIAEGVKTINEAMIVCRGTLQEIVIPDSVTDIDDFAFSHCSKLTNITIGDGITKIGKGVFYYCSSLTDITIPDGVTSIGTLAFYKCSSLTNVTIPDSVTSIGEQAFYYCPNLNYNTYDNAKYLGNANNLYAALVTAESDITSCAIHNDTKVIAAGAFQNCDSLASVVIPDGVICIGDYAFDSCRELTSVNIPDSVTHIGTYAFRFCRNLSNLQLSENNSYYSIDGSGVLFNKDKTELIFATEANMRGTYVIPDSVKRIDAYAFYSCDRLYSIAIPKSVTYIGESAFDWCDNLKDIWYGSYSSNNINGDLPTGVLWHLNYCGSDGHKYDYACDDACRSCSFPRDASHVYDNADDVTCNLCKQTLAPAAPAVQSVTETTVILHAIEGYEYSMDAITWQQSNVFIGLQPATTYKFYQRVAAGADNLESPASKPLSVQTDKYVPDIPWGFTFVEITDTSVRLNEVADCEYSIDGRNWQTSPVFTDLTPGTRYTFYQRIAENSAHYASANAVLHVTTYSKLGTITYDSNGGLNAPGVTTGKISTQTPTRSGYQFMGWALTPNTYAVYKPGDSYNHQEDILLYADWEKLCNNCGGDAEYFLKCSRCSGTGVGSAERCYLCGGKGYVYTKESCPGTDCFNGKIIINSTQIIDCPICKGDGMWEVPSGCSNCDETGYLTYSCSACSGNRGQWLTCSQCVSGVRKFTPEAPQMPKLLSVSNNTVVLVYYSTCEYSVDGVNWQDSNVFSILDVNRTYLFYQRYKEATYTNHSNASPALSVTTLKESVLPPQPPVLQSKTFNKVILEKVNGCEYSLDGINWQTSNIFDDLHPSTSYTFYCRFAETATHLYSAASDGLTVVTEQSPLYNVVFVNWNGTVISSDTYRWGDEITVPANPTKAADNTYTYTFAGWDNDVVDCVGNATYTATYTPVYINYTVVFKDWDDTVLSTKTYHWGDVIAVPASPTKEADNTYTYTFAGWDKTVTKVTGDVVYTATYAPAYISYTVIFQNYDGTLLSKQFCHYGDSVLIPGNPSRYTDETYTYAFAGWDNEVTRCYGDKVYTATYTPTYRDYIITFINYDGSVISEQTYHYGDTVTPPADPTRASSNTYKYTFHGWNSAVTACTGSKTYTAVYTSEYIDYTITFKNYDGAVISSAVYHYGDSVVAPTPTGKPADNKYTYNFAGWDSPVVPCDGNKEYTATYTPTYINYTIVFKNWDGSVISTTAYQYGDAVTVPTNPTKEADDTYTYTFAGWDKEVVNCAGDAVYTAIYDSYYIDYTVVFKDWDGTVLFTNTYHWGDAVTAPADPIKAADETYTYTFIGWDKSVVNCAGNAVYTATYEPVYIQYTVEFKDWDGAVISSSTYHWGDTIVIPSNPGRTTDGTYKYSFSGWGTEIQTCTGNATYTAAYEAVKLLNGWMLESGKWYYYKNDVKLTGWLQSGNTWYFLNGNGVMLTGWQQINGIWYYFASSGAMQTGWLQSGSTWYYLKSSGAMATGWENISGIYYFFNSSGIMQTGWLQSGNTWYYLKSSGAMATGWAQDGGKWYYFNTSGAMVTGWQKIGNTWYYFQSGGAMQTGWLKDGGVWYYFHSSGAMATGSVKVGAKTYNFNSSGACLNP